MSLVKTWYSPAEAASKFGIPEEKIREWVDEGLVRAEKSESRGMLVNIDDVKLQSDDLVRES